jgi:hypothetical protein
MSMKRIPWLVPLALVVAAGCGDPERLNIGPQELFEDADKPVAMPYFGPETDVVLLNGNEALSVGVRSSDAYEFFVRPPKSYEFRDLRGNFGAGFKARGWETESEGYGIIAYGDRMCAAVREVNRVDDSMVQEVVEMYRRRHRNIDMKTIAGTTARYWFWEEDRHRVMICATRVKANVFNLTVALGELNTLNGLRMGVSFAADDVERADRSLQLKDKP